MLCGPSLAEASTVLRRRDADRLVKAPSHRLRGAEAADRRDFLQAEPFALQKLSRSLDAHALDMTRRRLSRLLREDPHEVARAHPGAPREFGDAVVVPGVLHHIGLYGSDAGMLRRRPPERGAELGLPARTVQEHDEDAPAVIPAEVYTDPSLT